MKKTLSFGLACLSILTGFAAITLGNETIQKYVPITSADYNESTKPYVGRYEWTKALGYAPLKTGANYDTGYVGIYSSAWIGAAATESWLAIDFEIPYDSAITAEVNIIYVGDAVQFGPGSFSGTSWVWQLDTGPVDSHPIEPVFSWEVITMKIIDMCLSILGLSEIDKVGDAIELAEFAMSAYDLTSSINDAIHAGDGSQYTAKWSFIAGPGRHTLWVGIRGDASGVVTGSGFAIMFGQIPDITLRIRNGCDGPPDLTIQNLIVPDPVFGSVLPLTQFQKGDKACFDMIISNVGKEPTMRTQYSFDVHEPNEPNENVYRNLVMDNYNEDYLEPYKSVHRYPAYTFGEKGYYTFRAVVDPCGQVGESDETNNEKVKKYYVKGFPPERPAKPTVPESHILYRNNVYTFCTSTTDPENDPLKYSFRVHNIDTNSWYSPLLWDANNHGWLDSNCADFAFYGGLGSSVAGTYYVAAQAIDSDGLYSGWSEDNYFEVIANAPTPAPDINAPDSTYTDDTVSFRVSAADIENDRVGYRFDWGDGSPVTDYYWPLRPGESIRVEHKFNEPGTYAVRVQAKDFLDAESTWANHQIDVTVYTLPFGTITVKTNNPDATFAVSGPENFNGSGTLWTVDALPGTYTITFGNVNNYNTPSGDTKVLVDDQSTISFQGTYTHKTGTIQVYTNLAEATFYVRGSGSAQGQFFSGDWYAAGPWVANAGDYTIHFYDVSGYCKPAIEGEIKALSTGQTITFDARYTLPPISSLDVNIPRGFAIKSDDCLEFDGSASHSPEEDVNIAEYRFYFGDGEMYVETEANAPDGNFNGKTFHAYTERGYYYASLGVKDSLGNDSIDNDGQIICVKARPEADLSFDPAPAIGGEAVHLHGSGSDPDGDAIIAYEWKSNIDGNLSATQDFNTSALTPGEQRIYLRVEDSNNLWSEWNWKSLYVYEPLKWPIFKKDDRRLSSQGVYWGRFHGLLTYTQTTLYNAAGRIIGSPVATNLDANLSNGLEIAFASQGGTFYVINNNGTLRWSKVIGPSNSTPAIADINNDGKMDIVIGSTQGVYAYDGNGNSIYTFVPGQGFDSTPIVADIDSDPCNGKETIIGCNDGRVYALDMNGNQLWAFASAFAFAGSAAVAEIEPNSPGLETVIAGTDGILYFLDCNGLPIAFYIPPPPGGAIYTTPAIVDFDPMPGPEILFGSDDGYLYCVNYNTFALNLAWRYATAPLMPIRSSPAVGVGYSGQAQVAFGCDNGNVYVLQDAAGAPVCMGTFRCGVAGDGTVVRSTPAIANIDSVHNLHPLYGDLPEVIVGASDGKLYGLSFAMGGAGVNLPWSPMNLSPGVAIDSSPAVADINHEPDLEILIGANNALKLIKVLKNQNLIPVANFTGNPQSGDWPLQVSFTDQSTNTPLIWSWDFGDGAASEVNNPIHTYNIPGTYTVKLTVANAYGSNSRTKSSYITVNPVPVAAFSHTPACGTVPLQVAFTDESQYGPTSWTWNFGDGNTSNQQNPSHSYTEPNFYTVTLTVSNAYGSDAITKTACILARLPEPNVSFTQDVTSGQPPLTVNFTDQSSGTPTEWLWNFGDGNTSSQQNPSYEYKNAGNFLVSLTVSNSSGSDTITNSFYIRAGSYLGDFDHDGDVDSDDLAILVDEWLRENSIFVSDIAPTPAGDGTVNLTDFALFAQDWLQGGT